MTKDESVTVGGMRTVSIGKADSLTVGQTLSITATDSINILWLCGLPSIAVSYTYGTLSPCTDLKSRW